MELHHAAGSGVCIHRRGRVLFVDDEVAHIFGSAAADLVGRGVLELFHPESHGAMRSCLLKKKTEPHTVTAVTTRGALQVDVWLAGERENSPTDVLFVRRHGAEDAVGEGDTAMEEDETSSERRDNGPAVLICDDENRLAALTAGLLEEYGFEPLTVAVGDEALRLLTDGDCRIGALLLDVNLTSGLSARDLLDEIDSRELPVGVILTSGLAPEDVPQSLLRHRSVVGYLPKPYSVEQLIEMIRKALDHQAS